MDREMLTLIINLLLNIGLPLFIIILALVAGTIIERKHYESIKEREEKYAKLPVMPSRDWDQDREVMESRIVYGSVVISIDYFKRILASFRNLIGGRIRSYESLIDRGRREALLRMKEEFPDADVIVNFRMETSTIAKTSRNGKQGTGGIEIVAYGTAIKYAPEA